LKPFFGLENVQSVSHRGVLLDANAFFLHPSLSLNLKVTIKYWSAMRQAAEIKQETRQINSSVTVMSHGRKGELIGVVSFCGLGNVQARPFRGVSWDHSAFSFQSSLSRNLTAKPAFSASRSRLRRAALPLSETFSAEARSALSVPSVLLDVPASATVAVASRAKADSQQIRHSLTLRPRGGCTSRMPTQPRAPRGLEAHTLKNVAARYSVACGPETHSCGAAVGH
jgi:hypothetical protein